MCLSRAEMGIFFVALLFHLAFYVSSHSYLQEKIHNFTTMLQINIHIFESKYTTEPPAHCLSALISNIDS